MDGTILNKKYNLVERVKALEEGGGGGLPDYSTTEQKTGQKWIDGKYIYTITVVLDTPITIEGGQWGVTPLSAVNIDTITSVIAKSGKLVFGVIGAAPADGYVNLMNNSGNSMSIDTFTIWYTKTETRNKKR